MTIQPKGADAAKNFSAMANRIGRNLPEEFGGAFVVVFPSGHCVSYAAFDPKPDDASFGGLLDASVRTAIAEMLEREKSQTGYAQMQGRR